METTTTTRWAYCTYGSVVHYLGDDDEPVCRELRTRKPTPERPGDKRCWKCRARLERDL